MRRLLPLLFLVAACDDAMEPSSIGGNLAQEQVGLSTAPDAGRDAPQQDDGGPAVGIEDGAAVVDSNDTDARTLIIGLLKEANRGAGISCPCKADRGDFSSAEACIAAIGYTDIDIECVSEATARRDTPAVRAQLACEAKRTKQRNDCHARAACVEDDVLRCDETQLECPPPDAAVLTEVLMECPSATVFGR